MTYSNGKLPKGWRLVKLGEVCRIVNGTTPKTGIQEYWNGEIVWITPTDLGKLDGLYINDSARKISKAGYESCHLELVPTGSVVLSSRAPIGHLGITNVEVCTNQGCKTFVPSELIDAQFLYFTLKQAVPELQSMGSGATFTEISKTQLQEFKIPLPPLAEQKRIVAVLNQKLVAIEQARAAAQAQLEAAQALPAAYLRAVFDSPEAQKWPRKTLDEVCSDITDGTHHTPTYIPSGVPFLSVKDVRETGISFDDCRYISVEEHKQLVKRCKPEKGDVLYTKVGTTGIAKTIDIDREFSIFVSVALLKLRSEVIPEYIEQVLNSPLGRKQAEELTQGMANRNLVIRDIKKIEIPVPPIPKQKKITALMSEKRATSQVVIRHLQKQLDDINTLPAAYLRQAFNGEL